MTADTSSGDGAREDVLRALTDADSQAILESTATEPASVPELVERCDIPISTAYRKVTALVEAGLLEERIRVRPEGGNLSEYCLRAGKITVTVDGTGEVSIDGDAAGSDRGPECSDSSPEAPTQRPVSTDGGEEIGPPDSRDRTLRGLFVDITGVEEVVARQDPSPPKQLLDGETSSIAETVENAVQNDGLAETIEEPETGQTQP